MNSLNNLEISDLRTALFSKGFVTLEVLLYPITVNCIEIFSLEHLNRVKNSNLTLNSRRHFEVPAVVAGHICRKSLFG